MTQGGTSAWKAAAGGDGSAGGRDRRPAGPRWIDVPPERLARWVEAFASRHGDASAAAGGGTGAGAATVMLRGADGASAECHLPFPPLRPPSGPPAAGDVTGWAHLMAAHAAAGRTVGVVLVRLGGYAAGVFTGDPPSLAASRTGSRLVHGRAAAGGWSQHRFARRRDNQAAAALKAAADTAVAVLTPWQGRLDAVVLGGDRRTLGGLRDDPRLRPFLDLAVDRFLTVPDPRLAVLAGTPRMFRAIRIRLTGPA